MRLNFILLFALFVTIISTTIFALSTAIGEVVIKHTLSSIIENEIKAEYRVEDLHLEENLSLSFSINIENRDVANISGYLDLNNLELILNYSIINADSKWFKKLKDFGEFSSSGEVKINFFEGRVDSFVETDREKINFKYRKKFLKSERYLDIKDSSISVETLHRVTGLEVVGERVTLNSSLSGNKDLMRGEINCSIKDIQLNGNIEYRYSTIYIYGVSPELDGDVNISIDQNGSHLEFKNVALERGLSLFNVDNNFKSRGDMSIFYNRDEIEFFGHSKRIELVDAKYLEYLDELFGMNIEGSNFRDLDFNGEINSGFANFNFSTYNQNVKFRVENGTYNTYRRDVEMKPTIYIDGDEILSLYLDTSTRAFSITPTELGIERLKENINLQSLDEYREEITNLVNVY